MGYVNNEIDHVIERELQKDLSIIQKSELLEVHGIIIIKVWQ